MYHLQDGAKCFGELHARLLGVTETILSCRLKQLEQDGLVSRRVFGSKPPLGTEYVPAEIGCGFLLALSALTERGNRIVAESGSFIDRPPSLVSRWEREGDL